MTKFILLIRILVWLLAILKCIEMLRLVFWVLRKGREYRIRFFDLVLASNQTAHTIDLQKLRELEESQGLPRPFFFVIVRGLRLPGHGSEALVVRARRALGGVARIIDRLPVPILALAALVMFAPSPLLLPYEMLLIIALIYIALADVLFARAVLGFADNLRRVFEISPLRYYNDRDYRWSKTDFARFFFGGTGLFLLTAVCGFAAIYYGLYYLDGNAFQGLEKETPVRLQFLFFSLLTTATAGYLAPKGLAALIVVGLQMLFNIAVIVLLIVGLSVTLTPEHD